MHLLLCMCDCQTPGSARRADSLVVTTEISEYLARIHGLILTQNERLQQQAATAAASGPALGPGTGGPGPDLTLALRTQREELEAAIAAAMDNVARVAAGAAVEVSSEVPPPLFDRLEALVDLVSKQSAEIGSLRTALATVGAGGAGSGPAPGPPAAASGSSGGVLVPGGPGPAVTGSATPVPSGFVMTPRPLLDDIVEGTGPTAGAPGTTGRRSSVMRSPAVVATPAAPVAGMTTAELWVPHGLGLGLGVWTGG
jgi:hypothetical protein